MVPRTTHRPEQTEHQRNGWDDLRVTAQEPKRMVVLYDASYDPRRLWWGCDIAKGVLLTTLERFSTLLRPALSCAT